MNKILPAVLGMVNIILFVIIIKGSPNTHKNEITESQTAASQTATAANAQTFGFELITRGTTDSQTATSPGTAAAPQTTTAAPVTATTVQTTTAAPPTTTTVQATTTVPPTTTTVRTTAAPPATTSSADYSIGRPTMDDFDWYWRMDDFPESIRLITEPAEVSGRWKALSYYLNDDETGIGIKELLNINITADYNNAEVVFDWYRITYEYSEWEDEDYMEDLTFNADVYCTQSMIDIYCDSLYGCLSINQFWEYEGCQYAIGLLELPSGHTAYLALVRP